MFRIRIVRQHAVCGVDIQRCVCGGVVEIGIRRRRLIRIDRYSFRVGHGAAVGIRHRQCQRQAGKCACRVGNAGRIRGAGDRAVRDRPCISCCACVGTCCVPCRIRIDARVCRIDRRCRSGVHSDRCRGGCRARAAVDRHNDRVVARSSGRVLPSGAAGCNRCSIQIPLIAGRAAGCESDAAALTERQRAAGGDRRLSGNQVDGHVRGIVRGATSRRCDRQREVDCTAGPRRICHSLCVLSAGDGAVVDRPGIARGGRTARGIAGGVCAHLCRRSGDRRRSDRVHCQRRCCLVRSAGIGEHSAILLAIVRGNSGWCRIGRRSGVRDIRECHTVCRGLPLQSRRGIAARSGAEGGGRSGANRLVRRRCCDHRRLIDGEGEVLCC